jgi:hypothetical protein
MKKKETQSQEQERTVDTPQERSAATSTTDEEIARRAYAIFQERGGFPGSELDDWLQAERELRGEYDRAA